MTGAPANGPGRRTYVRQFLIQGCWNYEGMQNVGFAYCVLPALRRLYAGRPDELVRAVKRHLEFFNTHPALAGVVLGAALRLEERAAEGKGDPRAIGTFKVGLMGSLGAIGDSFFWGALKPMAAAAGALLSFVHPLLGIAALLILYNAAHLRIRRKGFAAGAEGEESAVRYLKGAEFGPRTENGKMVAAVLAGAYAGAVGVRAGAVLGGGWGLPALLLLAAGAVHLYTVLLRKAVSPSEVLMLLLVVGSLILWH